MLPATTVMVVLAATTAIIIISIVWLIQPHSCRASVVSVAIMAMTVSPARLRIKVSITTFALYSHPHSLAILRGIGQPHAGRSSVVLVAIVAMAVSPARHGIKEAVATDAIHCVFFVDRNNYYPVTFGQIADDHIPKKRYKMQSI